VTAILCCFSFQVDAFMNSFDATVPTNIQCITSSTAYPMLSRRYQHSKHRIQLASFRHRLHQTKDPYENETNEISSKQKAQVVLYRITLISASIAYACGQLSNLLIGAGGAGLSVDSIASIQQTSHDIVGWGILFAALLAPPYLSTVTDTNKKNDMNNTLFLLLNELLPTLAGFAIIFEVVNAIQASLSQGSATFLSATSESLDYTTNIFISFLCLREIGFFGAGYKAEAILAILFCAGLGLNDSLGFSEVALTSGLGLSLLVLSFAKVFEPLEDDLEPNQSAFFMDDRM